MRRIGGLGLLTLAGFQILYATHLMGGEIMYECIGANRYRIRVKLYRDCSGIDLEDPITLNYASAQCNVNASISLSRVQLRDITPVCPGGQSRCSGSGPYGWQEHIYEGILQLPPGCSDWTLWYYNCCRNSSITTGPADDDFTIYAQLNNTQVPCNNSPVFVEPPAAIACLGQRICINPGVTDPDGDDLVFSLTFCRSTSPSNSVGYGGGFSGTNPLPTTTGTSVDPQTGTVCFTPSQLAVGIICLRVEEYRGGVKIGEYLRDIQVRVINCTNQLPTSSGINGVPYDPGNPSTYTMEVCATGTTYCFSLNFSDPNPGQNLTVSWNNGIPGASFTVNNNGTPTPTANFCWTPTPADIGQHTFVVTVRDDACPLRGVNTYGFVVNVIGGIAHPIDAGPDATICQGQSVLLNGTVAGPPGDIQSVRWVPATGLSNPNILTPTASPSATTTYTLEVTFVGGCTRQDQVTVTVLPLPAPPTVLPTSAQVCTGSSVLLTASSPGAVDYEWREGNPGGPIVHTGATFNAAPASSTTYYAIAIGANGCRSAPTPVVVTVNPPPPPVSCVVIYVTPNGCGGGPGCGTRANPANLPTALSLAQCNNSYLKLACGVYTIDNPISFTSNTTVEGGYEPGTWVKTNGCQSIIRRSAANVQPNPNRLVAIELNSVRYFGMYDVTIQTVDAPPPAGGDLRGVSTYALYMINCQDYKFVRCRFEPGRASDGAMGENGAPGRNAADFQIPPQCGEPGEEDDCDPVRDQGGAGAVVPWGANGGRGGRGGHTGPGFQGSDSPCGGNIVCIGGTGGAGGAPCGFSPGCDCDNPANHGSPGQDGGNGGAGAAGAAGPPGVAGTWFEPGGQGGTGAQGQHGRGGGGGGGGGGQTHFLCFPVELEGTGAGGGGGGAGGEGGQGGTGGWGGGGSFGVYLVQNGANGQFIDCGFNTPVAGAGGPGGAGGNGGQGSTGAGFGGNPTTCPRDGCDIGYGGPGGRGGNGGPGGSGGPGQPGIAFRLYIVSGNLPSLVVGGAPIGIALGGNNPPPHNFAAEPVLRVSGFACTNRDYTIQITSGGFNQWVSLGPGATAPTPNPTNPLIYQYTTVGRKTVVVRVGGVNYSFTEFIGILLPDNQLPTLSANPLGPVCEGTTVSFSGDLIGIEYQWEQVLPGGGVVAGPNAQAWQIGLTQAGTHTIRHRVFTDCCGWTPWSSIQIEVQPQATVTVIPPTPTVCFGESVTLTANAAPPGSTILWSPATGLNTTVGSSVIASPLASTTYTTLVIPPGGNCVATANTTVNVLPLPNATPTVVPATCGANGSITLTITAGTPPVSVTWNTVPPQTGLTATNLQPGPYAATLTDANGCVNTVSAFVGAPPGALLAWLQSSQEPLCHGQSNGSATIGVTGGTPPYTYSWSHAPALNASVATGLPAGGYTVTVTDNAGCSFVVTFSLGQPAPLTLSIDPARQNEPVSCSGSCNGIITVEADGGVPPRTYTWSSSTHPGFSFTGVDAAGTQVSGLCEGEYTINVTDANGCTASLTVTLGVVPLSYSLSQVDALCFGAPQGSVSVTINSAHSGTTWQWTGPNNYTSALNETNPTGLVPGKYYITFTIPGCLQPVIDSIEVGSPPEIVITPSPTLPLCHGDANGLITIIASGGVGNYQYNLNGGAWRASNTFSNLAAGTYVLGVKDGNECEKFLTYTLPEPDPLTFDPPTIRDVSCHEGSDGSITVGLNGGTPPYEYSLNGGITWQANPLFSGLPAGSYTITVRDANSCTASQTVTIHQPDPLAFNPPQIQNVSCHGGNNGSITISVNGGTPPYEYSLNGGITWQANPLFSGLPAGSYTITVRDANSCTASQTVTIHQPDPLAFNPPQIQNVSCHGGNNGSITISVNGGTPPYEYSLNGGITWQANPLFSGLPAGSYTITVRDANSCTASQTVTIHQPDPLAFNPPQIQNVSCHGGNNGSITISVNGGTPPYEYSLNGGITWQANPLFSGLPAGSYTITVRDANSCTASQTVTIHQPDPLAFNPPQIQNVSCHGGNNGSITISVNGGTPPYEYSLNGGITWQANPLFSGLPAGSYTVTVRDANQCTLTQTINISQPPPLSFTFSVTPPRCHGETGTLSFQAVGGVGGYEYGVNGTYSSSSTVSVPAGTYTLTVRDANGCLSPSQTITIAEPPPLIGTVLSLSPATCRESADGTVALTATGGTSTTGTYTYIWISHPQHSGSSANTLRPGEYEVVVRDENGCEDTIRFSIGYRSFVDAALEPLERTGCIPLAVEWIALPSGVGPFTYEWDLGTGTTATDSVVQEVYLVENRYTIRLIIRNRDGCSDTANAVVEASALPEMSYIIEPDTNEDRVVGTLFTLRSTGQNVEEVWWEVEGYGRLTGSTIQVRFDQEGIYCYTFWARRGSCIDSTEGCIRVKDAYVYIPNAFSPNGDGINDVYEVRTFGLQRPRVRIYDRWGALVFDNQGDMNRHWDGTYRGVPVPEDAYTVVIEGVLPPTDKPIRRTGTVTVVR
ncbi:MAG: gliding motility-associated C-terminal domain-containing protein [Bacteroidia bacterium]|nr:gliding motility-associated C-terminal domain-containing protein [Bacteroidia bacterium]